MRNWLIWLRTTYPPSTWFYLWRRHCLNSFRKTQGQAADKLSTSVSFWNALYISLYIIGWDVRKEIENSYSPQLLVCRVLFRSRNFSEVICEFNLKLLCAYLLLRKIRWQESDNREESWFSIHVFLAIRLENSAKSKCCSHNSSGYWSQLSHSWTFD